MAFKGVANMDGDSLVITTMTDKGEMKRTLKFNDAGMIMVKCTT